MFELNTNLSYSILLIKSIGKRSFEAMGRLVSKSGDTISRNLRPSNVILNIIEKITVNCFSNSKQLYFIIDETLIKKLHSQFMQGTGFFYDTKLGRKILAYKLLIGAISDGRFLFPLFFSFIFDKDLLSDEQLQDKDAIIQSLILKAFELFGKNRVIVVADGAFATIKFLKWSIENNIKVEVRMHNNRKVLFKGKLIAIRDIKELKPKGRQMARTIKVIWHDIELYITAQRRIDKHGNETVVYQASTFKAKPSEHVRIYKNRWPIEKFNRTSKQSLGLQDCYSTDIDTQMNHIANVFLAFSFAQLEMKNQKLENSEEAIKAFKLKNTGQLFQRFKRLGEIFGVAYA